MKQLFINRKTICNLWFALIITVVGFGNQSVLGQSVVDTDGDQVADNIDLDDDNDGILDNIEQAQGQTIDCNDIDSYIFDDPQLISGGANSVGAEYRFSNVKSGVDGLVTILSQEANTVGGGSVGLISFDDNGSQTEYWKPIIYRNTKYIEFNIEFVISGTNTPVVVDEMIINLVDIDGSSSYTEYYEISNYSNYSTESSTNLSLTELNNTLKIIGHNQSYGGVSLTSTDVMASINFENKSNFTFKIGVHYFNNPPSNISGYRLFALNFEPCNFDYYNNPSQDLYVSIDSDNDGIPNHLDLDSDNDGCSDANEAYGIITADGGDGGQYGVGNLLTLSDGEVNAQGLVVDASYNTGEVLAVVDSLENTVCMTSLIITVNDAVTGINGFTGEDDALNIFDNDSINGVLLDSGLITLSALTTSPYLTLKTNGSVDVLPNTPSGTYTLDYQICEVLNPANCSDATVSITVESAPIVVLDDSEVGVNGLTGGENILNVFDNDSLNGSLLDASLITLTELTSNPNLTLNPDGSVDVQSGTPSGTYILDYQICEVLNPTNCSDATVSITVEASPIVALDDSETGVNGLTGGNNILNVFDNDSLNGSLLDASLITLTELTSNPNLELNPDGSIDVQSGTPLGVYTLDYQICEVLNPTNCSDATVSITIDAAPIVALDDSETGINGLTGGDNILNVFENDSLNGVLLDASLITLSELISNPNLELNVDGSVDVLPNTPSGTYTLDYQICEVLNPANCSDATVSITVESAPIVVLDDSEVGVNGLTGGENILNVFDNDNLNGSLLDASLITLTELTSNPNLTLNPDGSVDVQSGTPSGTYILDYQICEVLNPTNCSDATVSITVEAAPIVTLDDSETGINGLTGGDNILNVFENDSLNGSLLDASLITLTELTSNPNLTLNPDGSIDVQSGTPLGIYTLDYQICEVLNPTNCSDATVSITIEASPIVALDDSETGINGLTGQDVVLNVFDNDSLNGSLLDASLIIFSELTSNPNLELNSDGSVDVLPNTPSGTYILDYQICEILNPANCSDATVSITVEAGSIVALDDSETGINGLTGQNDVLNIFENDSLNGVLLDASLITLSELISNPNLTLNPDGSVDVQSGTPSGTYILDYQICEVLNPTNCSDATVSITVEAAPIVTLDDSETGVNGLTGGNNILNVFDNDSLNGSLLDASLITLTELTSNPNLELNPDGSIDVQSGTPLGVYTLDYQICEVLNPTNCSDATVSITIDAAPIVALDDSETGINGLTGGDNILNVFENDSLNGVLLDASLITLSELISNPNLELNVDGSVDVLPNTPSGVYTLDYQICEVLNPTNCSDATVSITVESAPIVVLDDSETGINGLTGQDDVLNIFDNDSLNGVLLDASLITLSELTSNPSLTLNPDGSVDIQSGTPSGVYTLNYQICEVLNPTNCSDATVSITVEASPIVALDDSETGINGLTGGDNILNVFENDSLNGSLLDASLITLTELTSNPNLTLNPDGSIDVQSGTPLGIYTLDYQICEVLNPTNCSDATVSITIEASPIVALDDSETGINGLTGQDVVLNVFDNDSLNGSLLDASLIIFSELTSNPNLELNSDGSVDVLPNTPSGTYTLDYQICEVLNPANCSDATVSITVEAGSIVALDDSETGINGLTGQNDVLNIFENDSLNGVLLDASLITLSELTSNPNLTLNPDGSVDVQSGTPSGTYILDYQICEVLNPTNCSDATVSITVEAAPIVTLDDYETGVNGLTGGNNILNVFDNDSLNGSLLDASLITLTELTSNPNLELNPDGSIDVQSGTPLGVYTLDYQICEVLNPTNCSDATVSITIDAAPIVALDDSETGINGLTGGDNILNVFENDSLNGVLLDASLITLSELISNPNLELNVDGSVDVLPNTPSGTYTLDYQICEVLNPANCSDATVSITVEAAPIVAIDDSETGINGLTGGDNILNVFDNDSLNGVLLDASLITLSELISNPNLELNADGSVDVQSGTLSGTYTLDYQICEVLNPTNCSDATVSITIDAAPIVALDDSETGINGLTGGDNILNVFENDSLNGVLLDASLITLSELTSNPNLELNPDGSVDVLPNTPSGTYTLDYQICEVLNPTNCSDATVSITVDAALVVALDDSETGINGFTGGDNILNVFDNDSLNGELLDASLITLTELTSNANLELNADGSVDVQSVTPSGVYTLDYQICEVLNPTNCSDVTVSITVDAAPIVALDDSETGINGFTGANNVLNIFDNDSLNGELLDASLITLTELTSNANLTLNADGSVDVQSVTPSGVYTLDYQICEVLNPTNCSDATVSITVDAAPIVALDDSETGINGLTGQDDVLNIFDNDSLNGVLLDASLITLSELTSNANLTLNADGSVDVQSGTPSGVYTLDYQICEVLNPTNCSDATVSITVDAALVVALDDSETGINGFTGGDNILNVFDNDSLNGELLDASLITLTELTSNANLELNADGSVDVQSGTPSGVYTLDYQICEVLNPTNCSDATVSITVEAAPIVAIDDSETGINGLTGGDNILNVFDNDSLNGVLLDASLITLSELISNPNLELNADGSVDVQSGTPSGVYTLDYQICEALNSTNCSDAMVSITVEAAPIVAIDDFKTGINGLTGEDNVLNIFENDSLNGVLLDANLITLSELTSNPNLELNADGSIDVKPGTPTGDYSIDYKICEQLNLINCSEATVAISVRQNNLEANLDDFRSNPVEYKEGGVVGNVLDNDLLNKEYVNEDLVELSLINSGGIEGLEIDQSGYVFVPDYTPSGVYEARYRICEKLNTDNCKEADIIILVESSDISIEVHNVITSNNDGMNDWLVISNIQFYPENTLKVFNRWGRLVYQIENYGTDESTLFRGYANVGGPVNSGDKLPTGTYFFLLEYKSDFEDKVLKEDGYIYIKE